MNSVRRAPVPRVDVAGSVESSLEALRRRSEIEDFELVEWSDYAALADDLDHDPDPARRLLLLPCASDELPGNWVRRVRDRSGSARVVILADGAPVPTSPVLSWFPSTDYLATLVPGTRPEERCESHQLRVPSERRWIPSVIHFLCERFEQLGWSEEMVRSILPLIIDEAVSNAMGHGNGWDRERDVFLRADLGPAGYRIEVRDQGSGFVREEVRDPVEDENLGREGGRGLFLMERLVDQVSYEDGGRRVVLQGGEPPSIDRAEAILEQRLGVEG